jgi:hypothetical protein
MKFVILSRRHPGGVEDDEESPATSSDPPPFPGFSRGFLAALCPSGAAAGSE